MAFGRSRSRQSRQGVATSSLMTLLVAFMLGWAPSAVHGDSISATGGNIPTPGAGDHGPSNGPVMATFSTSFSNVTQGRTLNLSWSHIDPKYEPLSMTARLINRTTENRANGFSIVIAARIYNASSWAWPSAPLPLPYLASGLYELEIRPAIWNLSADDASSLNVPVLARSSFFTIADQDGNRTDPGTSGTSSNAGSLNGTGTSPSNSRPGQLVADTDHAPTGPNRVALALGLSIGLVGALALTAVLIFLRRRHRRNAIEAEKRRRRRFAYMID